NGFPTLLFVTTDPRAEQRIADAASRACFNRGTEPVAVLTTTTHRITSDREGILGRIWRRPGQIGRTADDAHQYWLTDGRSNSLLGVERIAVPLPRSACSTPGTQRMARRPSLADFAGPPEFREGPPPFKNSLESPGFSRDGFRQHQRPAADGEV